MHTAVEQIKQTESRISTRYCSVADDHLHWSDHRPVVNIVQQAFGEISRVHSVLFLFVSLSLGPARSRHNSCSCYQQDSCAPDSLPSLVTKLHIYFRHRERITSS